MILKNLVYYVGKRKVETIFNQRPEAVCRWKAKELKQAKSHTIGTFKLEWQTQNGNKFTTHSKTI